MFVQVRAPVVSAIIDIDFLQTKQRPTGTTGTSKYAGGASILMSIALIFRQTCFLILTLRWVTSKINLSCLVINHDVYGKTGYNAS
jgi:hypothetical protein